MSKTVAEAYDELWHYTSAAGAEGIISSGSVWATHAAFLNDTSEIQLFFDKRLPKLAKSIFQKFDSNPDLDIEVSNSLRKATLEINDTHIFSMTVPTDRHARAGGLLSQWRGYGPDGGYALVFDPKGIKALLTEEENSFSYQHMICEKVHYHGIKRVEQPSTKSIAKLEKVLKAGIAEHIQSPQTAEDVPFYKAITSLSCLYKHWGFYEEREVRIIAVPSTPCVEKSARAEGDHRLRKPSKTFLRSGIHVPYIELFAQANNENPKGRLPLKRVVIGPHFDAERRKQAMEHLLRVHGYSVRVELSKIPYLGR